LAIRATPECGDLKICQQFGCQKSIRFFRREVKVFRCQLCKTVVPAGTRTQKLTTKTRPKEYPSRGSDPSERRGRRFSRGRPSKQKFDKGGTGFEIVQEISVCPACAETENAKRAEEEAAAQAALEAAEAAATAAVAAEAAAE
jgi:rubredoxin